MLIVPAPKSVTIDGDLHEWDMSAAIDAVFDSALKPRFTLRLACMYDAKALYIAAHFVDDTPMLNRHDPAIEPSVGWAGDCLQVRLCSDAAAAYPLADSNSDRLGHATMWYFTDAKLPVLHLQYGMDYHGTRIFTGKESGLAFRADADRKGYTLEARIPWQRLNAAGNPPKAGDRIALVMQPQWSDSTGRKQVVTFNDVIRQAGFSFQGAAMWGQGIFLASGNLPVAKRPPTPAEEQQPLTIALPVPDPQAKVLSAAIYDAGGVMVRTLPVTSTSAGIRERSFTLRWDGLDDDGNPLPAGRYKVKVLTHRGIGQRWVTSLHNAGNPPWRTDDGTGSWGGDHAAPIAAASDRERVYLGWTVSEAGWAVIAVEKSLGADGKPRKLWGVNQVNDIGILVTALATDGERVFTAQDGRAWGADEKQPNTAGIVMWDAKTGRPVNFPFGKRALVVDQWPDTFKSADLQPFERMSIYHPVVTKKRAWERFRDKDFGPHEMGLNIMGLAVAGDVIYAAMFLENKVVALNWRTGEKMREFAVPRPVGLSMAQDGGLLAVSGQQVVRIDPQSGQVSAVVSAGLEVPWGLATDGDGRVYVTDCGGAMQTKVFDAAGKPAGTIGKAGGRPWVGAYDPEGMLKPAGITVDADGKVWVCEQDDTPRRVSVWTRDGKLIADLLGPGAYAVEGAADVQDPRHINVHNTLFDVDYKTGKARTVATLIRPQMRGFGFTPDGGFMGRSFTVRHVKGQTYYINPGRGGTIVYRLQGLVAEPVAAVIPGSALPLHGFTKDEVPAAIREEFWHNPWPWGVMWADRNGEGLIQEDELVFERVQASFGNYWGAWVDDDLTIWTAGSGSVWRLPVIEWRDGVPVYQKPSEWKPLFPVLGKTQVHSVMPEGDAVYVLEQDNGDAYGKGAKWQAVSRYTRDGQRRWAYRRAWLGFGLESPLARPGDVVGAMKFIGNATLDGGLNLLAVNGYFGQFNLLSGDGLWVASLCKDNRYGPKADETTVWPENFSGFFFRNRDDGKVYLIAGDTDARIWEVTGLDSIRTAETEVKITDADRQKALRAAQRRQGVTSDLAPIRMVRAKGPMAVDGDLKDWDMTAPATITAGGGRGAKVALVYDDAKLYAAFEVSGSGPMRNNGKDFALLFKTGASCEVFLGADTAADPRRAKPVPGDVRVLFSVMDGQPVCVVYEAVVRDGERAPRMFTSPTGAEPFDRVALVKDAQVAIVVKGDGYVVEAAVPLAAVKFAPKPQALHRGDVGVILADSGGSRNVLRVDYANKDTAIVNDIPSEARLEPGKWGIVRVE
jgi:hypothetical protein